MKPYFVKNYTSFNPLNGFRIERFLNFYLLSALKKLYKSKTFIFYNSPFFVSFVMYVGLPLYFVFYSINFVKNTYKTN